MREASQRLLDVLTVTLTGLLGVGLIISGSLSIYQAMTPSAMAVSRPLCVAAGVQLLLGGALCVFLVGLLRGKAWSRIGAASGLTFAGLLIMWSVMQEKYVIAPGAAVDRKAALMIAGALILVGVSTLFLARASRPHRNEP